jgi:sulfate permease, SulP family
MLVLRRFTPKVPGTLIAVAGAMTASAMWNFSGHGIAILGPVAGGLPQFKLPALSWSDLPPLLSVAASCSVMIITQSAATARVYAARHEQELDENADLAGLSAANAAAGLSGTFVVNGSPTQTAMVEGAGAESQVAQLATAGIVAVVLVFFTQPLQYLPRCVLGALVFVIAIRLIKVRTILALRRESPGEFGLAVFAAGVVVAAGVEQGILLAMILSLLRIVQHSYDPHTGVMSLNQGGIWQLNPVTAGAMTEPGLVMYRFEAELFYANANGFSDEVRLLVGQAPTPVRWLIVDAESITHLDYSAARVIEQLQEKLKSLETQLGFARMPFGLRADFARHRLNEVIDPTLIFNRLHEALAAFEKLQAG